ncbi:MAG: hypothetical protein AAFQ94_19955 [Bacteroidota bacterium]
MKRLILTTGLAVALFILSSFSGAGYEKKMQETITKMYSTFTVESYLQVANQFAVIGKAEPTEWLPWYYHANANIMLVFIDTEADFETKQQYLKQADRSLAIILEKFPEESEIQVMNAFYAISKMAIDPANAGQYIPRYNAAVTKAVELEPENPRARFFQISSKIGEAQFFGKPTEVFCDQLVQLEKEWDAYQVRSVIHPQWGKDDVKKKIVEIGCTK